MTDFEIGGVRIRLHFSFFLFNAVFFLLREDRTALYFYAACIIHELGHVAAAFTLGVRVYSFDLKGSGICICAEKNAANPMKNGLLLLLSGPALNLICAIAGFGTFADVSLILGIYNLLPYRSLDGGSIVELFIMGTSFEREAEFIRRVIVCIITIMLIAVMGWSIVKRLVEI